MKSIYNYEDLHGELTDEVLDRIVDGEDMREAIEEVVDDLFAMLRTDDEVLYNFIRATNTWFEVPFDNDVELEEHIKYSLWVSLEEEEPYALKNMCEQVLTKV